MPAGIEAVVFDVGRVIVEWDLRYLFAKLIDDSSELEWFCANVVSEEWHFRHDAGEDLADLVAERKAQFPQHTHLIDAYAARFLETIPALVPGTADIIEELAAAQIPLFAITNFADPFWREFYPTQPVLQHFRDVVVSGTERLVKPDPRIFYLAEARFGYSPQSMLFIDDNLANVTAAGELGWATHHFAGADGLRNDLRARGLI